jgi:hypothetical protein
MFPNAEDAASKLAGVATALGAGIWKVEPDARYAGSSGAALKNPRVIERAFTLTAPDAAS